MIGWLLLAVYYFYQYALRSAPSVMMPHLQSAFGLDPLGVASLVGLFYYGYSPFSLVAGVAIDRFGPRRVVPLSAAAVGVGALLFASGHAGAAAAGRFLQGAGGVFALVGAVYVATRSVAASRAATLIGATQMFGMAGGSAGPVVAGPMVEAGVPWTRLWALFGLAGLAIAALLLWLLPSMPAVPADAGRGGASLRALGAVFRNPQSILCGLISGLLFIPTTILDMTWGVRFLEEGRGLAYGVAVLRSAAVPLGWIIGCPLLGWISDRIGRRRPVIAGGGILLGATLAWVLYGPAGVLPRGTLGLLMGIASGAAMLPYTVIKEANPPSAGGTATGVVNFLNFTFSALLGPVFGWWLMRAAGPEARALGHYQTAFAPMLAGVALAIALAFVLKETGPAARAAAPAAR